MDIGIRQNIRNGFSQYRFQGCHPPQEITTLGEGDQPMGQFFCLQTSFLRDGQQFFHCFIFFGDRYLCEKDIAENGRKETVKILGNTIREMTQRLQPLDLGQLLLGALALGDVLQGFHGAHEVSRRAADRGGRETQPPALVAELGEKVRRFVSLFQQPGLAELAGVPVGNRLQRVIHNQIRHAGPVGTVKSSPVFPGADDILRFDPAQLLQRSVPVNHPVIFPDEKRGDRRTLDHARQSLLAVPQLLLGALALGDVLQGFHGAHEVSRRAADRGGRETQPPALVAELGEKVRRFVSLFQQPGLAELAGVPVGNRLQRVIHNQIRHAGPVGTVKSSPVFPGADDILRFDPAQLLQRSVPVNHPVIFPDEKRGDRRTLDHARQSLLAVPQLLLGALALGDVPQITEGSFFAFISNDRGRDFYPDNGSIPSDDPVFISRWSGFSFLSSTYKRLHPLTIIGVNMSEKGFADEFLRPAVTCQLQILLVKENTFVTLDDNNSFIRVFRCQPVALFTSFQCLDDLLELFFRPFDLGHLLIQGLELIDELFFCFGFVFHEETLP